MADKTKTRGPADSGQGASLDKICIRPTEGNCPDLDCDECEFSEQRRPGRPYGSTSRKPTKAKYIHVRCTEEEKAEIDQKAESAGMTTSKWIRRKCLSSMQG